MPFEFFQNGMLHDMVKSPNDAFRERQQEAINARWEATTARYTVKEQKDFGSNIFCDIEVWIDYVVGMGSRGTTNGDDFRQLIFKDISHPIKRGLYYQFDNNYWLTYFTDEYESVEKSVGVRRCNNVMRIVDPDNGGIFTIPCVIDYDMASPSQQVSTYIITPNNHATVMVQGNEQTLRLFKLNTRFIFGGRPFKLLSYQNALIDNSIEPYPTLLYLDLYLDEIHAKDDIANQLAYNGDYAYSIGIDSDNMELVPNSTGSLTASVALNGEEVKRNIVWVSSDTNVAKVDVNGNYTVVGKEGGSCKISAYLENNKGVIDSITIKIVSAEMLKPKILVNPLFDKVRQYETIEFEVQASYGDKVYNPDVSISLSPNDIMLANQYIRIDRKDNVYNITGLKVAPIPQILYISVHNIDPVFDASIEYPIKAVSMMG